jgi:hypothetical protein
MYLYVCILLYFCTRIFKLIYLHMDVCINACMHTCMSILRATLHCNKYLPRRKESTMIETFFYTDKIVSFILIKSGKQLTVFSNILTSAILWMINTSCLFPDRTSSATDCVPCQFLVHHKCVIYALYSIIWH